MYYCFCKQDVQHTLSRPWENQASPLKKKIISDKQIIATIKLFHEAVSKGEPREVQSYLEHISFLRQSKQKQVLNSLSDNTTVIYKAIERCDEIFNTRWDQQILLGLARHSLIDINETGKKRLSSLILALQQDNPKAAEILLNKSDDKGLNVTDTDPDTRNTPLHLAIAKGYDDISKTLLAYNTIDINAKNKYGYTPLHLAILNGRQNIIKRLVASKEIDINAKDEKGYTPLHVATLKGDKEIIEILINAYNIKQKKSKKTPLESADAKDQDYRALFRESL